MIGPFLYWSILLLRSNGNILTEIYEAGTAESYALVRLRSHLVHGQLHHKSDSHW